MAFHGISSIRRQDKQQGLIFPNMNNPGTNSLRIGEIFRAIIFHVSRLLSCGRIVPGYPHMFCIATASLFSILLRLHAIRTGENAMAMTVEIKNDKLCIEIDLEKPTPSASGKTLVVASTHGNMVTTVEIDGKPVTIGLNAYIKP